MTELPAPTSSSARRDPSSEPAVKMGFAILLISLVVGAVAGSLLQATKVPSDSLFSNDLVNSLVLDSENGVFNWVLMLGFVGVGLVSFAVCYAAATITARLP